MPVYWRATPRDFLPSYEKIGLVDDEHPAILVSQMLDDVLAQVIADGIPAGVV